MATETIDERVERLSRETGGTPSPSGISKTPEEVESELNQDMGYQLSTGPDRVLKRKEAYEQYGLTPPTSISKPGTKALDEEGPVHKYVRPALELGGAMAGGTLGATMPPPFTGPIGGTIGGTLGFTAGDTLSSFLERLAGERPPVESPEQAVGETVGALKGGGAIELASRGAGKLVGTVGSKVLAPFAKQYEGANRTLDEVAKSKGITLAPYEALGSRPLSLVHRVFDNTFWTSGRVQRKELEKLKGLTAEWNKLRQDTGTAEKAGHPSRERVGEIGLKIQDSVDSMLDRIGIRQADIRDKARDEILTHVGSPLTYKELGEQTQQAITQHHEGLQALERTAWDFAKRSVPADTRIVATSLPAAAKQFEKDYENLGAYTDENLLAKLKNAQGSGNKTYDALRAQAMKDIPEGLPSAVRQKLINEAVGSEQPGWKLDDLMRLRSELSKLAAEHHSGIQRGNVQKGSSDTYGRMFNNLKDAIDEDVAVFAERQGSDVADLFHAARAASGMRKGLFNAKEHPGIVKAIKADPRTVADSLILPNNASGFTELKNVVGPQASEPVKQAFTNKLFAVGGNEESALAGLRRKLDGYGRQTIQEIYTPQESKDLYQLADKSTWMKRSPIGNPFFRQLAKTDIHSVAKDILGDPDLTAKYLRQFPQHRADLREVFVTSLKPNDMTPFPTQMLKHLNAYPADVQKQLFSQQEIKEFYTLANIIERTKGAVKLAENTSGTAQNIAAFSEGKAMLRNPITMAPTVLTTSMLAKLYLSKTGRKYLTEGLVTPTTSSRAAYITSQILGVAGIDAVRDAQEQSSRSHGLYRSASPQLEPQP